MNPYTQGQAMPGMEFFQSLLKGSGMPTGFASWMAPTMDPSELEQKITDLKAVLQWLEANARLTQATIQTLEVQRMTLSALKTMNVDLGDLASRMTEAMQAGAQAMGAAAQDTVDAGGPRADDQPEPEAAWARAPEPEADLESGPEPGAESPDAASALPGVMDPMQWWNAVSQQFSQVATQALRESPWPMPAGGATAGVAGASASSAGTSATSTSPARGSAGKPQPRKSRAEARSSRAQAASEATAKSPAQSAAKTSTRAPTASGPGTARKATAAPRSAASKTRRGSRT